MERSIAGVTLCLLLALAACATQPTEPGEHGTDDLIFRLTLGSRTLHSGETLTARLSIVNVTNGAVELISGCGTLAYILVHRGGEYVALDGTVEGCRPMIGKFQIAPGDSLVNLHEIRPTIRGQGAAPRGTYTLRAQLHVQGIPDLVQQFTIQ